MQKTAIMVLVVLFAVTGMAYAGAKTEQNCGCGLGTLLMQDMNDGIVTQVAAATTNGTFGNQTFGITSGTLECDKAATLTMKEKLDVFVADNMDNVASDIAAGQGESLDAIANIAEIADADRANVYAALQSNFQTIYPNTQVTNETVSIAISNIISQL